MQLVFCVFYVCAFSTKFLSPLERYLERRAPATTPANFGAPFRALAKFLEQRSESARAIGVRSRAPLLMLCALAYLSIKFLKFSRSDLSVGSEHQRRPPIRSLRMSLVVLTRFANLAKAWAKNGTMMCTGSGLKQPLQLYLSPNRFSQKIWFNPPLSLYLPNTKLSCIYCVVHIYLVFQKYSRHASKSTIESIHEIKFCIQ